VVSRAVLALADGRGQHWVKLGKESTGKYDDWQKLVLVLE